MLSVNFFAKRRPCKSDPPPGAKGTMMRAGREGQLWAWVVDASVESAVHTAARRRTEDFMRAVRPKGSESIGLLPPMQSTRCAFPMDRW